MCIVLGTKKKTINSISINIILSLFALFGNMTIITTEKRMKFIIIRRFVQKLAALEAALFGKWDDVLVFVCPTQQVQRGEVLHAIE